MLPTSNVTPMISHVQLAEMTGKRQDNVKRTIETLSKSGVITFTQFEEKGNGRPLTVFSVNERDSYIVVAQLCPEYTAKLVDHWMATKNKQPKPPALPSVKELALMVIAAEEEKEAALLLVEQKSQHIESLESLFHSGGTIAQFAKQLNGINCQKINLWLNDNTSWLYDENKGKVDRHGRPKPYCWRCASYARDQYLTERPKKVSVQGMEEMTKYEVTMLAKGKKWLFKKYINGDLDCCMKANWDGKYTQEKDIK